MRKLILIFVTWSVTVLFIYSLLNLLGSFSKKKLDFPVIMDEFDILYACSSLFLVWQFLLAGGYFTERSINDAFAEAVWANFKSTFVSLLICVPMCFIFIGFLIAPFIISISAICLTCSIIIHQVSSKKTRNII